MIEAKRVTRAVGHLLSRGQRIVNDRFFKKWGTPSKKRALWDAQYASGQWDYLEHTSDDPIYPYLERYSNRGRILDLGCGSSNTGNEMDVSTYDRYTGVDISEEAIQRAVLRSLKNGRQDKNEYFCDDIATHVPRVAYDVILFRESLFYIPLSKIKTTLERYSKYLTESGVFIVRMCDQNRYRSIVRVIERSNKVLDRSSLRGGDIILVFR